MLAKLILYSLLTQFNLHPLLFTFIPSSITKENIDIIIKMREDNIPVEKIAYYTGIPKEIIVSI